MSRPFRFSVQAFAPASAAEWYDTARAAEDLGYSCLHLADHYFGPGDAASAARHPPQLVAAIPAMMAAAAVTTDLRVGARVMCVDYHHPVVLAKSLATIEMLSGGRLEAGFGAGWITSEYEAMGLSMDRPGTRIDRMLEYVEVARAFFAGSELDVRGRHVAVGGMTGAPASPRPGGPPIMIGGGSPRVLRAAGAVADIVSLNFDNSAGVLGGRGLASGTAAATAEKIAWVREGAGERFAEIELETAAYFVAVTDDAPTTIAGMSRGFGMSPDDIAGHVNFLIGSVDELCETLEQRRHDFGISYVCVAASSMHDFAPVVARLAGT